MKPQNNFNLFINNYYNSAYIRYTDLSFNELIIKHSKLELEICFDIDTIISYYLSFIGYNKTENIFYKNRKSFSLFIQFIDGTRTLHISFRNEKPNENCIHIEPINHFGAIKEVLFDCPNLILNELENLISHIKNYISVCYTCMENSFRLKCTHLADKVCEKINLIIRNHFHSKNKSHLLLNLHLFLFQKNAGLFYFDKESYGEIIDKFKSNQNLLYSPFELIVWLLTNPLQYEKSLTFQAFKDTSTLVWQEWDKSNFRNEKKFYEAASRLYSTQAYAVIPITRIRNNEFSLSIAFMKKDKRAIIEEIQKIKNIIKNEFEKEVNDYLNILNKINLRKFEIELLEHPQQYGEIIGQILAGFFKGMIHLH